MAAGEDQPQPIVGVGDVRIIGIGRLGGRLEPRETLEDPSLVGEIALAAKPVDGAVSGDPRDPGSRIGRRPVARPALQRSRERVLDGVLGGVEIAEDSNQDRDRPSRLTPEQAVDLIRIDGYDATSSLTCSVEPPAAS